MPKWWRRGGSRDVECSLKGADRKRLRNERQQHGFRAHSSTGSYVGTLPVTAGAMGDRVARGSIAKHPNHGHQEDDQALRR